MVSAAHILEGKLLGALKLANASAKEQAEASFEMLQQWKHTEETTAMVFTLHQVTVDASAGLHDCLKVSIEKNILLCLPAPYLRACCQSCLEIHVRVKKTVPLKILFLIR